MTPRKMVATKAQQMKYHADWAFTDASAPGEPGAEANEGTHEQDKVAIGTH